MDRADSSSAAAVSWMRKQLLTGRDTNSSDWLSWRTCLLYNMNCYPEECVHSKEDNRSINFKLQLTLKSPLTPNICWNKIILECFFLQVQSWCGTENRGGGQWVYLASSYLFVHHVLHTQRLRHTHNHDCGVELRTWAGWNRPLWPTARLCFAFLSV